MRRDVERLALTMTREQGKQLGEAKEEVLRSTGFLEWGGEQARRSSDRIVHGRTADHPIEIQTHPIGVVAAFTPWNFPMALAAKRFVGVLGTGCAIFCNPSEETPSSVLTMAKALLKAGITPTAISVVFGDADQISKHLIVADIVAKITLTDPIPIGKLRLHR